MAQVNPKTVKFVLLGEIHREVLTDGKKKVEVVKRSVVPSKKNQKVASISSAGLPFIGPNPEYIKWKRDHDRFFNDLYGKLFEQGMRLPIVRCDIKVLFYYPNSIARDNHNKFETIADMLVEHQIVADDSFMVFNNTTLRGVVRRDKPRTEVYLTIMEPGHPQYEWDTTSPTYKQKQLTVESMRRKIARNKNKHKAK